MAKVMDAQRTIESQATEALTSSRSPLRLKPGLIATYVVLTLGAIIILLPFAWLVSASFKDKPQYFAVPLNWIPNPAYPSNYGEVFSQYNMGRYIFNSVWLATYAVVAITLSSALVAYGFARFRFPGRSILFLLVLATMMLPNQVLTISLYGVFKNLGWINTFLPIMVPSLFGSALQIFLLRQFFLGLSYEIDEAARIDGAGAFGIFWRMILPQSKPVLIVVAIFTFLGSWRDTWGPLIYLNTDDKRTLPLGLLFFTGPYGIEYPKLMAASVIALVVPVILYIIGQRYIDSGIAIAESK